MYDFSKRVLFLFLLFSVLLPPSHTVEKQLALASKVASRFSFGLAVTTKDGVVLAKAVSNKGQTLTRVLADEEGNENEESDKKLYIGKDVNSDSDSDASSQVEERTRRKRINISNIEPKLFDNDKIGTVVIGLPSDCRFVMDAMMGIAAEHRSTSGDAIRPGMLADKIASMFHKLSLQSGSDRRLLAVEVIIASRDEIVFVDCSGYSNFSYMIRLLFIVCIFAITSHSKI